MKISHLVLSAILLCISTAALAQKKISYRFATKAEAQMLITDIDNFTNKLNSLDINLRLGKEDGRKSELLRLAMNETLNWSDEDKKKITAAFKSLQAKIDKQKLKIKYPHEIILVKTSMKEEMNVTAYTRKNWIALGEDFINKATKDNLEYLLAHEMFHLLTRSDKNFKKSVYSVIGFEVTDRELFFPIDIVERKISNPDIEQYDSYAEFTIDGTKQKCSMIIYSDKAYTTGGLGDYLNVGLIPLDDNLIPLRTDGKTIIYGIDKAEDFYDKVGRNTKYTINPEEILADNFAYLLIQKKDLPNPEIIKNIAAILK
ncbi:hypothetical protein [uncultured Bacteroides sp.]|uniref:hypothetical protein n=1 Tax=uncultured Bacteroides sp. TaxID=162156 RepID=UPI002594CBD4|nr:hypothetical protein [uncultured Bacteroides sp.]MDN0071942.1 hypothetical protein [Bacteroides caecigallinarum]